MRDLLAVLALLFAGAAAVQAQQSPTTIPEMWTAWCARCHGVDGSGKVEELTVNTQPLDFSDCRVATPEPDADWELAIARGGPAVGLSSQMPSFGDVLTTEQVLEFVAHLRTFCRERGWPIGNLNFPRPIFTEKAFPENEMVFLPAVAHRKGEAVGVSVRTVYERRVGRRAHVEFSLPVQSVDSASRRQTGVGDIEVAAKFVLTPNADAHIVSAGLEVALPSGNQSRGLGSGTTVVEPYLAAGATAGSAYVQAQFKLELPWNEPWEDREAIYNLYVGQDTSVRPDTWTLGIELNGANREVALTPQIRKGLTRTGALAATVGVRLPLTRREDQGVRWVGYLLWEYLEPVLPRD